MLLKLVFKKHHIDNIWIFRFQPSGPLVWTAGQYIRVELPHDQPDEEGVKRWFTNSAAPYEGVMQITTRITNSTFKQALARLELGDTLAMIEPPEGDFVWQDSPLPIVFVAGGIGVTPFHSIMKQRVHDGLPLNLTLVYGSRTPEVPFKDELETWAQANPGLHIHYLVGPPLDAAKLAEVVPNLNESLVYISGSEPMVDALEEDLRQHGLPKKQLKKDAFPNYTVENY